MNAFSRRDLLGAISCTTIVGAGAGATLQAAQPDLELLALCARFDALRRQVDALYDPDAGIRDDDERDEAIAPIELSQGEILRTLCILPARTLAGVRAKARSLTLWEPGTADARPEGYWSDHLCGSILRDLVGDQIHE